MDWLTMLMCDRNNVQTFKCSLNRLNEKQTNGEDFANPVCVSDVFRTTYQVHLIQLRCTQSPGTITPSVFIKRA